MAGSMAIIEEYALMVDMVLTTGARFNIDRGDFLKFQDSLRINGIVEFNIMALPDGRLSIAVNEAGHIIDRIEETFEQILFSKTTEYEGGL